MPGPPSCTSGSALGRVVTHTSQGRAAGFATRCASRKREPSSSQCPSSTTISVGIIRIRSRKVSTAQCNRSRLAAGSSAATSAVTGTSASNGIASSDSQGARSGIIPVTNGPELGAGLVAGAVGGDADELAQQRAERGVRLGRRVVLRSRLELLEAECERAELVHEP